MDVTYLWPPWLSGSYHLRFEGSEDWTLGRDRCMPYRAAFAASRSFGERNVRISRQATQNCCFTPQRASGCAPSASNHEVRWGWMHQIGPLHARALTSAGCQKHTLAQKPSTSPPRVLPFARVEGLERAVGLQPSRINKPCTAYEATGVDLAGPLSRKRFAFSSQAL